MKNKFSKVLHRLHPRHVSANATYLLKDEAISGKLIIVAVVLALIAANTPLGALYESLWATNLNIGLGDWSLSMDIKHWINDGLMAIFFLVVGLELKREITSGDLGKFRTAILPFAAAVGGMIVPALIYLSINSGTELAYGWAIPTATDIALAIGLLALLGKRIPSSVRLFLLTLAIVDDMLAVIIIALFYNDGLNIAIIAAAAGIILAILLLNRYRRMTLPLFIVLGVVLWLALNASGVHASIAGAILGLLAPTVMFDKKQKPISERLEHATIPISTLFVVPLFAFANTGIVFTSSLFDSESFYPLGAGILLGLVFGKVAGILLATWLAIKFKLSSLPQGANWGHICGIGLLAGIGFTVSIFVAELAFQDQKYIDIAKFSIFIASIISAMLGMITLRIFVKSPKL